MAKKQSDYLASLLAEDEAEAESPQSDTQDAANPLPSRGEPPRAKEVEGEDEGQLARILTKIKKLRGKED